MKLRRLRKEDASLMLEWMHDDSVVHDLNRDFSSMTYEDCEGFIERSIGEDNLHMAIVDDKGEYMGTVSLKGIDHERQIAEFGIVVRKAAMGGGFSIYAMREMLKYAGEHGLKSVFWCVSPKNKRALRFYDKNGFKRVDFSRINVSVDYTEDKIHKYIWYLKEL